MPRNPFGSAVVVIANCACSSVAPAASSMGNSFQRFRLMLMVPPNSRVSILFGLNHSECKHRLRAPGCWTAENGSREVLYVTAGSAQGDDGRAPTSGLGWGVAVIGHELKAAQRGADDFALHTDAAPVNNTEGFEAQAVGLAKVFFDHRLHVARRDGVEVEDVGDGNANRFGIEFQGAVLRSKSPASRSQPGPKTITAKAAHPTSSDLLRPVLAHDRFHLIL